MVAIQKNTILRDKHTGLPMREVRLLVPDARHPEVRARIREAHKATNLKDEADAIAFIEAVSDYEADGLLEQE